MAFTHLHVHTEYSLLDGSNKIKEYVAQVKNLGMKSAAITDHGVMYGCIDFYKECLAQGIKPILGCEVYVAPGSRFDRDPGTKEDRYYHLILLAENNEGYDNLMRIVSAGFVDGFYYRPRVDKEILRQYHSGIIASSACLAGEVARHLTRGDYPGAVRAAAEYRDIFGEGNFFLELQDHGIPEQKHVNAQLLRMAQEEGYPLICTNDCHYTYEDDVESHDILLCIQTGKKVQDEDRMRYEGGQYYVKSPEEMRRLFAWCPEALENTDRIAERCNVTITFGERKIPEYDCPDGLTSWEYLNRLCRKGLAEKYPEITPEIRERFEYELETIHSMGFVDYFLIVWDYINYAREHGIIVGPGRGSAAGSIVSYTLGITELDPLKYNLLFERFLNPERVTMPDIDVDFCFERRQEVIDYVVRKYGRDRVVQIVTFGTMAARGVIRDVGRAMDIPYAEVDQIAKMVPRELNITLDKALKMNPDLKKRYDEEEQVHRLIDMSRRLEGLPRNTSMHAAGVVISKKPVVEYVPLSRAQDGSITTQYTMTTLEELGLLKMDFLGLRTLTVIQNAVRMANRSIEEAGGGYPAYEPSLGGEKAQVKKNPIGYPVKLSNLDYADPAVYASISTGRTDGIFQLESGGMQGFMKELHPENFEDIIAGISLYRPGPMDFIPKYIYGKKNPDKITYDTEELEPILEATYGCIVYQEQVMQIVRNLGGYTLGRSDLVRRAMSKKKQKVMEQERRNFVYGNPEEGVPGCVAKGISASVASHIYDTMMDFAKYAFNKSHAACYAVVAYQTAWLRYYYPTEFMAALMTSVIDFPTKVAGYILTCRSMGIRLLPPDINEGEAGFSVSGGAIRYGLTAIKGVGRPVIDAVIRERSERGKFRDLHDFLSRMILKDREVNKRVIENFIKAGALDCLGATRKQLMSVYMRMMDDLQNSRKNDMAGQLSLFDFADEEDKQDYVITMPDIGEYPKELKLAFEKEVLGIYVSGHPLEEYMGIWKSHITNRVSDFILDEETGTTKVIDGDKAVIGGMISGKKVKYTKNNKVMAFLDVEDMTGTMEVIVFPNTYEKESGKLEEDNKVFLSGRVSLEEERDGKLICEKVIPFDDVPRKLWIRFPDPEAYRQGAADLKKLVDEHGGRDKVVIFIENPKLRKELPAGQGVRADEHFMALVKSRFGDKNCVLA